MRWCRILSALLILAATMLRVSHAQTISGTVLDDSTSQPIVAAEVTILDTLGVVLSQTMSDSAGRFQVTVSPGEYAFRILRIGYTPTVTTVLNTTEDANELSVVIRVPTASALEGDEPYALAPVVVEAHPPERYLAGYYRRQAAGQGDFSERQEFEQYHPQQVTDVLRRMRGFTIMPNPYYGFPLPDGTTDLREYVIDVPSRQHRTAVPVECPPLIYLDGALMGNTQRLDINTLPLDAIQAVEVYARAIQTPMEYYRPGNDCGVIALWTRGAEAGDLGSPFEFGVRYGGTVAGGDFAGGRVGIHLITRFFGPLEFYPAVYLISSAFSDVQTPENSSWMAQIAARTMVLQDPLPVYVGSGLVLVKTDSWYQVVMDEPYIDPRYTVFAGLKHEFGIVRPFVELHMLDFFSSSDISAEAFFGMGFQF